MYRVSYERCVCFVLLVILAFLSCSGFRIDNLAMTDISRKNSHASRSSSDDFFDGFLSARGGAAPGGVAPAALAQHHRPRHHRQPRAPPHHAAVGDRQYRQSPSGHIDAYVLPPTGAAAPAAPAAAVPAAAAASAARRSPPAPATKSLVTRRDASRKSRQRHHRSHQEDVLLWKAYRAKIVLRARAESMSKGHPTYSVVFRILEQFKNSSYPVHDPIRVTFPNSISVRPAQEYVLFLNAAGALNYTPVDPPEKVRTRGPRRLHFDLLKQVCSPDFRPTPARIVKVVQKSNTLRPLKLRCVAQGFPPPRISWRRNHRPLRNSSNGDVIITTSPQRRRESASAARQRRRSTLEVRNGTSERDEYECVARGPMDDQPPARQTWKPPATTNSEIYTRVPCGETKKSFCMNGGECFMDRDPEQMYCECPANFIGERCQQKNAQIPSMYPQQDDICKLGLSTKYFC